MSSNIKVLMISSDRNTFDEKSAVAARLKEYGDLVGELHVIVLSDSSHGLKEKQLSRNVWAYPTHSGFSLLRPGGAASMGKKLVLEKKFVRGLSLITAQDPFECGWAALKIKRKWRLPVEVQLHSDPFSPYFSGFQNMIRKFHAKKILRQADSVRVVSKALANRVSKMTRAPVSVLPIFVDKKKLEEGAIAFDLHARYGWSFILLAVSRLAPEKNLKFALESLALARKKYRDIGIIVVGSGPEEASLKSLVRKLDLTGHADFVGWQDDIVSFYKTANAFIQTSLFEGYGLSLIEAGICGLPSISTPVGIAQEFEDGKDLFLIPLDDTEITAHRIVELVESNQKRQNLKFNFQRALENKLISREEYLKGIFENWEKTAQSAR